MTVSARLTGAVQSGRGTAGADALCRACVTELAVDDAALSLLLDGPSAGTFGASGARAVVLDEVQFTLGQGPCVDVVAGGGPVLVADLAAAGDVRWPAYRAAMADHRVCSVFAFPVRVAGTVVGALDLFRGTAGPLTPAQLAAALTAAELAAMSVLDIAAALTRETPSLGDTHATVGKSGPGASALQLTDGLDPQELRGLTRVEVAQATGMLVAQLDVDPVQALARLRAYAYLTGRSATDVARDVLSRVLRLEPDPPPPPSD